MKKELDLCGLGETYERAIEGASDDSSREAVGELASALVTLVDRVTLLEHKLNSSGSEKVPRGALERQLELFGPGALDDAQVDASDDHPLDLAIAAELEEAEAERQEEAAKPKGKPKRKPLPKDLPSETKEVKVAEEDRCCPDCGVEMQRFGQVTSQVLEWVPGHFLVQNIEQERVRCPGCRTHTATAPAPPKAIPKGIPGPGLLAHVLVSKYLSHLPLHRQAQTFAIEHGVELARSTLCGWVMAAADILKPIVGVMIGDVLKSKVIHTDDTSVRVNTRHSKSDTGFGRFWPYLGDAHHRHVVFDYTADRSRAGPQRFLAGFSGYLQADAYSGYDQIYRSGRVIEVACWAHARRYLIKARDMDPRRAAPILKLIQDLYDVERRVARVSPEARLALRKREAAPVLAKIEALLSRYRGEVLPKGPMGRAVTYMTNQWVALGRYIQDPDLAIDNNAAERAIRPVAIGRKNWLHFGSDAGGKAAAIIYSLICSCRLHDIDPTRYLADVIIRVQQLEHFRDAWALTPLAWKDEQQRQAEPSAA